jgi:hypothetical protein
MVNAEGASKERKSWGDNSKTNGHKERGKDKHPYFARKFAKGVPVSYLL